jgi:hypothetical protein
MGNAGSAEDSLAAAVERASAASRWDVVAALARELEARRLARDGNVLQLTRVDVGPRGRTIAAIAPPHAPAY